MELVVANLDKHFKSLKATGTTEVAPGDTLSANQAPVTSGPKQHLAETKIIHTGFGSYNRKQVKTGGGISYGQPQFFSPVYTPINWQIPSRRREIYMWSFVSGDRITTYDFSSRDVSEIREGDKLLNHLGEVGVVDKVSSREVDTELFTLEYQGYYDDTSVTSGHRMLIVRSEDMLCKYFKDAKNGRRFCRDQYICKRTGCKEYESRDLSLVEVPVEEVNEGDYVVTPIPSEVVKSEINTVEKARLLGYYCAEGSLTNSNSVGFSFNENETEYVDEVIRLLESSFKCVSFNIEPRPQYSVVQLTANCKEFHDLCERHCGSIASQKRLSHELVLSPYDIQMNFLGTYWNGDGCQCFATGADGRLDFRTASKTLADQLVFVLARCGIPSRVTYSVSKNDKVGSLMFKNSKKEEFHIYTVCFGIKNSGEFSKFSSCKVYEQNGHNNNSIRIIGNNIVRRITSITSKPYKGVVYDVRVPPEHTIICNLISIKQCRFWYENEPRVATSLDFYSRFPITGFETECSNRYVKHYFDELNKKLNMDKWARIISHEVHLLGDCFPFLEIECEHCGGSGRVGGEVCEHEGGSFKRLLILNPDFIEVFTNPISPDEVITYVPDDELRDIVLKNGPGSDKLSPEVKKMIAQGRPIPLDSRCVSHLKYGESGYRRYGISMIRRLFPILSYKTKIMTAQWIVAERMIVPIKVVKVGSDERPASESDIATVQSQLMSTSNDPNLCIVTHHAFDMDFIGASGKILPVSGEYEFINQEILDGFGLNKQLITGEGPCYHPDVEILTENGWKFYAEVEDGEKLATFNPRNNSLEYQDFINRIVRDYDGEIVHFETNKIDMLVTTNHRMWVQERCCVNQKDAYTEWKVLPAEDVRHRSKMRACVDDWVGEIPEQYSDGVDFGGVKVGLESFVRYLGYYISEGYASEENGNISQKIGTESCERIRGTFESTGLSYGNWTNKNGMEVFSIHKPQRQWLMENVPGKAKQKFIPKWVKNLPKEYLEILLEALIDGDGSIHSTQLKKGSLYQTYMSASRKLADDVMEISLKLGYSPTISTVVGENTFVKDVNYIQYRVNIPSSNIGKFPVLDTFIFGDSSSDRRKCISRFDYKGKVWCFEVPNEFLIVRMNGKLLVCGNTYSSAAMGAEIMIKRLESWRLELKRWIEEKIYLPVAKMRGFKEKNEWGEEEWVYPKLRWDSLNLRDRQQERQMMLQLYDKGLVSAHRVLEEFEIDPDTEFEQMRYERIEMMTQQPPGQAAGGAEGGGGMDLGGGGGGGGLSLGGGMDAPPEGGMGGPPGADAGGMPPPPGGGGGAMGGGMGAPASSRTMIVRTAVDDFLDQGMQKTAQSDPSLYGGKILTRETREKLDREREKIKKQKEKHEHEVQDPNGSGDGFMRDPKGRIMMTGIEKKVIKGVEQKQLRGQIRYNAVPSYEVYVGSRPVVIDIAFPDIFVGVECDGATFHGAPDQKQRDEARDNLLRNLGWVIIRFDEEEIESRFDQVMMSIVNEIDKRELWIRQEREKLKERSKESKLGQ